MFFSVRTGDQGYQQQATEGGSVVVGQSRLQMGDVREEQSPSVRCCMFEDDDGARAGGMCECQLLKRLGV